MSRWFMLLIAVCLISLAANAQQNLSSQVAASKEDIQKLFTVMNLRQQMLQVMDEMVKQQSQLMRDSLKKRNPQIAGAELDRLDKTMHEMMAEFPYSSMLNDLVPVYQKHLNRADVIAMTAFYSSPTGKKLLREMPAMTAESMQAAYPTMQAHMEKVMARIDEMTKEDTHKQSPPPRN